MGAEPQSVATLRQWGCLECDGQIVPVAEARRICAEADYLLLLDINEEDTDLQLPAKLFDYVQIGRPILAFTKAGSPTERVLQDSGVRFRTVTHDADDGAVDQAVLELLAMPTDPVRAGDWFEARFDGRNQAGALAKIIDSVLARANAPAPIPVSEPKVEIPE